MDRRVLAHVLVAGFLVAMFAWSFSRPGWEKQFKATGEALQNAQHFRYTIQTKDPSGERYEVSQEANCPNDFHSVQRHYAKDGTLVPKEDIEIWSVGNKNILRQDNSVMDTNGRFGAAPCKSKHLLELSSGARSTLTYDLILARGNAEKGSKKTVDGISCRQWKIELPEGNGWGEVYTVCIDERNLPLEVVMRGGAVIAHASFSNDKIDLPEPPEVSVGVQQ